MARLKQIKTKIRSVQKTRTVTKAMEAVSAVKMRKAQERALAGRAYARAALEVLARVSGSRAFASHPLMRGAADIVVSEGTAPKGKQLYIVITSDKGLAGSLNSGVLRTAARDISSRGLTPLQVGVIAVGRKANDFFAARGYPIESYHPNTNAVTPQVIDSLVSESASRFTQGVCDRVAIVYQNFVSTFEQRPVARTLFPLTLPQFAAVVESITPARGKYAHPVDTRSPSVYTIEPGEQEVLKVVLPKLASVFLYHALLESLASEHSARMVAMKSASDKASELTHALTLTFNKVRQAAITREVSEITGGMEAMATA